MDKYKTFEELKEELGDKFEEYMYKSNIELLKKLDNSGYCELKKKCDAGLCDCKNEEYYTMCENNMILSLRIDKAIEEIDKLIEDYRNSEFDATVENLSIIKSILKGEE